MEYGPPVCGRVEGSYSIRGGFRVIVDGESE